ncbi:MAG: non-ribosomal peptide synthetase [Chthoniobacterales bacterium]
MDDHSPKVDALPLPAHIAAQAKFHPDRPALVTAGQCLTYGELDRRAAQLAHHLRAFGAGPEMLIAICLERSPEFVIAALAILKCGAAYLPMDPAHPAERLRFVAKDAGIRCLLTRTKFAALFGGLHCPVVDLEAEKTAIAQQPSVSPEIESTADQLAYVIYTSGSTGQPKGVEITHANLGNLIAWHLRAFAIDSATRTTFQAGVGFDAAVWEIWPALAVGAAVYLPDDATRLHPESLRDWLVANEITISFVSTAIAERLLALPWPTPTALRFLLTGADTLHRYSPAHLPFHLVNNYGPTECTVVATSGIVPPHPKNHETLPTIGRPIDGVIVHVVDEQLLEVATGVAGEIFLGGAGVARGYRNRPDLTDERFLTDPFRGGPGRLYRTGDLGRRLPSGEIEFFGRLDDQVKIRGYRIELNEINAVLNTHPSVRASTVLTREDAPGEKRLVAYLVAAPGVLPNEQFLRDLLRQRLPDYMEPAAFVWLEALPLTTNGKIDRAALPLPELARESAAEKFVAPRTPVEEALAGIITEVLKLPRISVDDDFFQLGAHSLLGAQIIARVRNLFGADLKLLDVFDAPTVAELSLRIEAALTRQLNAMSEAEVEAALAAV